VRVALGKGKEAWPRFVEARKLSRRSLESLARCTTWPWLRSKVATARKP
jgi:hypothetical protein